MKEFSQLVELMETLRGEHGCPWDKKQTLSSFKTYLLEEAYELVDALEKENAHMLKEELGDLLFHIVFIAQIAKEKGLFDINETLEDIYKKMYRRHPHVFNNKPANEESIPAQWEEIKRKEKSGSSLLSGVPRAMPALLRAYTITRRAAKVGFDWQHIDSIYEKLDEEIKELKDAQSRESAVSMKEELGDILFTVVNISRFLNIDPEDALRFSTDKFEKRFLYIERNTNFKNSSPDKLDTLWTEIKNIGKKKG